MSLAIETRSDAAWMSVTLAFSEEVEYRLEESRTRLTLHLEVPLDEGSLSDRSLESDVVRRIRVSSSSRKAEVIFHLGRDFQTFSSVEARDPFRINLIFRGEGAPLELPSEAAAPGSAQAPATLPRGALPEGAAPGGGSDLAGAGEGASVIVLDPGHGGPEDGAVGPGGLKEKDLALDIAVRLRGLLSQAGYAVRLTREDDTALDLTRRTASANHAKASLFLSIHANASVRAGARGAETYFLSYDPVADPDAMNVADEENRPTASFPISTSDEEPGREIRLVLWEMAQAEHLNLSSRLADLIQDELNSRGLTKDRGVKQAPFRVLVGATMPAVLVEVGFLSNPEEERKLATIEYRDQVAGALAAAIARYDRERVAGREGVAVPLVAGAPR